MRFFSIAIITGLVLTACTAPEPVQNQTQPVSTECRGMGSVKCAFFGAPVQVDGVPVQMPGRPYTFFRTAAPLNFTDARQSQWQAPPATLTDGASIPQIFVHIVGNPTSPEFTSPAAVHDAYCGVGNDGLATYQSRRWQDTHAMFYDALRASGVPEIKAKTMFAAVYLGGPRWPAPPAPAFGFYDGPVVDLNLGNGANRNLSDVPIPAMQRALRQTIAWIESQPTPPSRRQIELYIDRLEDILLRPRIDPEGRSRPVEAPESPDPVLTEDPAILDEVITAGVPPRGTDQ